MNPAYKIDYRIKDNVLEVWAVCKWRPIRWIPHNHRARRGIIEGKMLNTIRLVLFTNRVITEAESIEFNHEVSS